MGSMKKRQKTLYLSGPITGRAPFDVAMHFAHAAERYTDRGWAVLSPMDRFGGRLDLPRELYMRLDIAELLAVDAIVMLEGWKDSKGASLEHEIARQIGLTVLYDEETDD